MVEDVVPCCVDEAGDEEGGVWFEVGFWQGAGWEEDSGEEVGVGGECFVEHLGVYAAVWKPKNFEPCPPGAAGGGEYDDAHAKRSVNDISAVDFLFGRLCGARVGG